MPIFQEISDLKEYLPSLKPKCFLEREFMCAIISTLSPKDSIVLIDEARQCLRIKNEEEFANIAKVN